MSTASLSLHLMASPQQAIQRWHAALEPLEVEVLVEDSESLIADESAGSGYRNQALIEVLCQTEDGQTMCALTASNLGVGPKQDDHCKGVLGVLAEAILDFSLEHGPSYAFERLLLLREKQQLSEPEFIAAKRALLANEIQTDSVPNLTIKNKDSRSLLAKKSPYKPKLSSK